jgi:recombination protein RecA
MADVKDKLRKEFNKQGDTIFSAKDFADRERKIVSVSPMVDYAIKGIPEGSWVILSGIPKCGKSITALQIAANAQQQYGKPVYYGNVEHRVDEKELYGVHGLDVEAMEMIQSSPTNILTGVDFLTRFHQVVWDVPECVLIIDSTSALCGEGEFKGEFSAMGRAEGPKLLAKFTRKLMGVVPVQKSIVIIIQHLIANTSGYGEPYFEDGGRKVQHVASTKLRCTAFQKWENAKKDDQIGQVINWQVKEAALTKKGGKFQSYLRFGYGLDDIKEYITLGMDMGIIDKGGAWFTVPGCEKKLNGEDNVRQYYVDNPEALEYLKTQVQSML